ncbi:MAG: hypothetical protein KAS64_04945 [Spirochaetes bacterium]|nr:hypothetical protein [Spirochaetota bacterium]
MATYSFLRIYRDIDTLEPDEKDYWTKYINKREHLKREYPEGIPMRVLYPEGAFNVREKHGSYYVDQDGKYFVSSLDIDGCMLPGPDEVPLSWYLLFTGSNSYFKRTGEALQVFGHNKNRIEYIVNNISFNLEKEKSTVYFLQQCDKQELNSFSKYLSQEDRRGFIELNYGEVEFLIDPLFADRIDKDKKKLIFPKQINKALDLIEKDERINANNLFEEVCLIHRQIKSAEESRIELDAPYDPFL